MQIFKLLPFLILTWSAHFFASLHFDCEGNGARVILSTEADGTKKRIDLWYQDRSIHIPIFNIEKSSDKEFIVSGMCNDTEYNGFSVTLKTALNGEQAMQFSTHLVLSTGCDEVGISIPVMCYLQIH